MKRGNGYRNSRLSEMRELLKPLGIRAGRAMAPDRSEKGMDRHQLCDVITLHNLTNLDAANDR